MIKIERFKALTQNGLLKKAEVFCNSVGDDNVISVSFAADGESIGRNKFCVVTYKA